MEAAIPIYVMIMGVIASLLLANSPASCCWSGSCHSPLAVGFGDCCGNRKLLTGSSEHSLITDHASECLGRCFDVSPQGIITEAVVKTGFEKNAAYPDRIRRPVNFPDVFNRVAHSSGAVAFSSPASDLALTNCSLLA